MRSSILILALVATTAAAPALSKMGACASVAPGEDLTAAGVKYRCEPSADHCGQTFHDAYTGPETGTEANFHTHEMLETWGISCEVRRSLLVVVVAVDAPVGPNPPSPPPSAPSPTPTMLAATRTTPWRRRATEWAGGTAV